MLDNFKSNLLIKEVGSVRPGIGTTRGEVVG